MHSSHEAPSPPCGARAPTEANSLCYGSARAFIDQNKIRIEFQRNDDGLTLTGIELLTELADTFGRPWGNDAKDRPVKVLPWVEVPHLASHLLSRMSRVLVREWELVYGHPVHFLETFVDPTRFRGTCYRAANWIFLGETTGRGKDDRKHVENRPKKEVLGYPLSKRFRQLLSALQ